MHLTEVATEPKSQIDGEPPLPFAYSKSLRRADKAIPRTWNGKSLTVVVFAIAVLLAIYLLRLDGVAGQFKDDGWYVVLAKSLATVQGYNMINLPQHSGLYFYPPLFPLVLSLFYRLLPEFPHNLFLLKSVSITSMFALGGLVFQFFNRPDRLPRSLAFLVAFATVAAPSFVFLATSSVMSECLFAALGFATLVAVDHCGLGEQYPGWKKVIFAAVLASACYLTRTIGIALVGAIAVHFLTERRFKALCVFAVTVTACIAPWTLYKNFRPLKSSGSTVIAETYSAQFWDRLASSGTKVSARDLPARVWQISTVIIGDDAGGLIMPSLYRSPAESGQELLGMSAVIPHVSRNAIGMYTVTMGLAVAGQIISACFSVVLFIGYLRAVRPGLKCAELFFLFSLSMIVFWPWNPIRFLVPLLPFLLYFFILGISELYQLIFRKTAGLSIPDPWKASRIVVLCIVAFFIYDNAMYVVAKYKNPESLQYPDWLRQFDSFQQAANWVHNHTGEYEVVAADNLPATYLYAQRKTARCIVGKCSREGIRYYITTDDSDSGTQAKTVFSTKSYNIKVLDVSKDGQ